MTNWIKKHERDNSDSIRIQANRLGWKTIDVRFTFRPDGSTLLAKNLSVAELTDYQADMIVEWTKGSGAATQRKGDPEDAGWDNVRALQETQLTPTDAEVPHKKPVVKDKYPHYYKDVRKVEYVDVYHVLDLWDVKDQMVGHAIKKLLAAGTRGVKDGEKDIQEALDTLLRRKEIREGQR
jgi:hypothetical protein